MASIQKITKPNRHGESITKYRVFIRQKGYKPLTKTFSRRSDAVTWARRIEGNRERYLATGTTSIQQMLFTELVDRYIQSWHSKDQSSHGQLAWWKKELGHIPLVEIDKQRIRSAMSKLAEGDAQHGNGRNRAKSMNRPRSNGTLNRYKAILSGVFRYAVEELDLPENPVRGIRAKPEPKGRVRYLSDAERARLLGACKQAGWDRLYLLVLMALTTGARLGELQRLNWGDINFKQRRAYVEHTKNGERRVLPLTAEVMNELKRFRGVAGLVFPSERKPEEPFEFRKHWDKALKQAEILDFRFHDLRHTAASYLAMNGATLLEIAEVLGHKQLEVTKRYAHLCVEHKQRLVDSIMNNLGV